MLCTIPIAKQRKYITILEIRDKTLTSPLDSLYESFILPKNRINEVSAKWNMYAINRIEVCLSDVTTHLKKIVLILIIANLFCNCETKKQKAELKKMEFYYPRISNFKSDSSLIKIYLDSIKNYGELLKVADKIACDGKAPLLRFSSDSTEFNLIVYKECVSNMDIVDYHGSNVIFIQKDSIIINDEIELTFDSLQPILWNHILNPNREFNYSKSIDKALIFYYQDSLVSIKKIKDQLIKITTDFNELNKKNGDSLPLKIKLSEYPYIRVLNPPLPDEE